MSEPEDIRTIIEGVTGKKVTVKLRAAMPYVERKLSQGVEHKEIVDALRQHGIDVSLDTFRGVLYRWRRRQKKKQDKDESSDRVEKAQPEKPIQHIFNKGDLAKARQDEDDYDKYAEYAREKGESS